MAQEQLNSLENKFFPFFSLVKESEKKCGPLREWPFRPEQVNQCPGHGDVSKKNSFFTEHLPLADFPISVYFLLELEKVEMRLKKKKI